MTSKVHEDCTNCGDCGNPKEFKNAVTVFADLIDDLSDFAEAKEQVKGVYCHFIADIFHAYLKKRAAAKKTTVFALVKDVKESFKTYEKIFKIINEQEMEGE